MSNTLINTNAQSLEQSLHRPRLRPRILLGITGSVAAVKGPELALRFARDCGMDVRILLTRGGQNFWEKACDYNPEVWKEVQERIRGSSRADSRTDVPAEQDEEEGEGTIQLHGT